MHQCVRFEPVENPSTQEFRHIYAVLDRRSQHVVRSIFYMVRVVKFAYVINVTHRQMISKTELYLSGKFGPLLSLANLADLLDRSVDGLRFSLSQDGEMAAKFNPAGKKSVGASISDLRSSLKCLMKKIEGAQFE